MKLLAWLVYVPLQLLWLPLSLAGAIWVAWKQIGRSRALGLSQTAVEILNGRWTADVFGVRSDEASRRLAEAIENNSTAGLRLALFPLMVARRVAGAPFLYPRLQGDAEMGMMNFVPTKSARFDDLIDAEADSAKQFVVLGASLDTRAYGPLMDRGLSMFELDRAPTQRAKRAALRRAGLTADHVRFIETDFTDPAWPRALAASTYDPELRTIFLWEGVTLYLSETDVLAMLSAIRAIAAPGSIVLLDLYGQRMMNLGRRGLFAKTLEATGESFGFSLDLSDDGAAALSAFADAGGYRLGRFHLLGSAHDHGALLAVAELCVPSAAT
ncbi:MAG: class I SAM-dependent methyltransferase [Pelagibaca sp.]